MITDKPGRVTERITLLGRQESCVYLVDGGGEYALLGGGMTYIAPDVLSQVREFGFDPGLITRLIIHHAHFDHVGVIPYLKSQWPWARVTASRRARDVLANPDVVRTIAGLNQMLLAREGSAGRAGELGLEIETIEVESPMDDGDEVPLGDLTLRFVATPGHSSCSMAVYIPELKVLSASDAGGIPFAGRVFTAANSNFDQYQQSLEKMDGLDVEVFLAEHYGALTGEDGRLFIGRSIVAARETRLLLEEVYARTRDAGKTRDEVVRRLAEETPGYFLPEEIMNMVVGQMTRFIAKKFAADETLQS